MAEKRIDDAVERAKEAAKEIAGRITGDGKQAAEGRGQEAAVADRDTARIRDASKTS